MFGGSRGGRTTTRPAAALTVAAATAATIGDETVAAEAVVTELRRRGAYAVTVSRASRACVDLNAVCRGIERGIGGAWVVDYGAAPERDCRRGHRERSSHRHDVTLPQLRLGSVPR
jgi:hypothetical protein